MPKCNPPSNLNKEELEIYKKENNVCSKEEFFNAVKNGDVHYLYKVNFLEDYLNCSESFELELNPDCESDEEYTGFIEYDSGSALMIAVRKNYTKLAKYLLDNGADANTFLCNDGWSALQEATTNGNEHMVRLLLEKGANPTYVDFGRDEKRPVDIAREKGFFGIEKVLKYYYYNHFSERKNSDTNFFKGDKNKGINLQENDAKQENFERKSLNH